MSETLCTVINAILYIVLFLIYQRKVKSYDSGSFILSLWLTCAVVGVLYEPINIYGHMRDITLWPYLYLFVCNLFLLLPILFFRANKIIDIGVDQKLLYKFAIFVVIMSIFPFTESLIFYAKNYSNTSMMLDAFNERYEDSSTTYYYLSTFSRRITHIHHSIRTIILFMVFYMPSMHYKPQGFKFVYFGICLSALLIPLESLCLLARFQVVIAAFMGFYVYLIVRNVYSNELKNKSFKMVKYAIVVFAVLQLVQTANRYINYTENLNKESVGMLAYLGQYLGESMGNFNGNIVHSNYYFGTDPILRTYGELLGLSFEKSRYFENRFHTNQFFTVVGEFWRAYGGISTFFIFTIGFVVIGSWIKKINYSMVPFFSLMLFLLYSKLAIVGIFYHAYFVGKYELIVIPFVSLLLSKKSYGNNYRYNPL